MMSSSQARVPVFCAAIRMRSAAMAEVAKEVTKATVGAHPASVEALETGDKIMTVFAFDERLQLDVPVEAAQLIIGMTAG